MRAPPLPAAAALLGASLSLLSGCSASPNEQGGDARFGQSSTADDAGACSDDVVDAGSPTWSGLYADYFGPTGKASCAGTGACHGSTSQPGYAASNYVCPGTAAECYSGITASAAGLLTPANDPTNTSLYNVLRKCSGGGSMPFTPVTVMFTSADMARIAAWIQAGAPDD